MNILQFIIFYIRKINYIYTSINQSINHYNHTTTPTVMLSLTCVRDSDCLDINNTICVVETRMCECQKGYDYDTYNKTSAIHCILGNRRSSYVYIFKQAAWLSW